MPAYSLDAKPVGVATLEKSVSSLIVNDAPHALAQRTDALLADNGLTFNEAGVSFNQAGVTFGGVYGFQDKRPLVSFVIPEVPQDNHIYDIGGTATPLPTGGGNAFGPGFFLFIPQ